MCDGRRIVAARADRTKTCRRQCLLEMPLAQCFQNRDAAYGEADDGSECSYQQKICAEVKAIGEHRADGADQSENVEPERCMDARADVLAQAQLQ